MTEKRDTWSRIQRILIGVLIALTVIAAGLVLAQDQETLRIRASIGTDDQRFPDYLARLVGRPLTKGDSYQVLANGEKAFPAMLAAIETAKERVAFESYIYSDGRVADQFTAAFEAAARRGVRVRLVVDSIGASNMSKTHIERLEKAGVKIGWVNPVFGSDIEEANYRSHRKALIVDGQVGYVGGMGIADHWLYDTEEFPRWRDSQFELRGPAVADIEAAFNQNWILTGGVVDPEIAPEGPPPDGPAQSIVVWSSPTGGANALKILYLLALAAAREQVDIQSPYLITDESTEWSLREARQRGVRIRLLVEGDMTDAKPVKYASRDAYERLLGMGIEIAEYLPTMMHTKAITVDGTMSIIGSANFDNRSLELNDELNVAVFDPALTAKLRADFESDLGKSKKLRLDEWRSRPLQVKARDWLFSHFGEVF